MSRQHLNPYLVTDDATYQLSSYSILANEQKFNESWLQDFIFQHPQTLPVGEIEPVFASLIPVCRELRTDAGPLDNLFINAEGLLTLVECKLWKNIGARREVVGQILDYAKELSRWNYEDLEEAIAKSANYSGKSLYELVAERNEELDEGEFIDNVSRNLRRGRFLLLIVGEGIRESIELIADFLQKHTHLNFSFALVEMAIFKMPEGVGSGFLVHPRVISRTVEIERAVVRIEDGRIIAEAPTPAIGTAKNNSSASRRSISEQAFYEKVETEIGPESVAALQGLVDKARSMDLNIELGSNSLKVKSSNYDLNFGVFRTKNQFENAAIAAKTIDRGIPQIGEHYLERVAALFPNGYVAKTSNPFNWTVKIGNPDRYVTIKELLDVEDKWWAIVQETLDEVAKFEEGGA